MAVLQRFYCISVASAALRSEATVRSVVSLFIVSPNICVFCASSLFCNAVLSAFFSSNFVIISLEKSALIALLFCVHAVMCSVPLPRGTVDQYVVCGCGVSWSYSLASFRRTGMICSIILASMRENLSSGVCEQHRRRPACASAQSDQRLCYSRFVKHHIQACYKRSFIFLASLCS